MVSHQTALIYTMVLVSAADGDMTDAELTVIGDITAIIAGGFMGIVFLGIPYQLYKSNTFSAVDLPDFMTGLIKASVFGLILSSLACYHWLRVTGGAATSAARTA